MVKKAKDVVNRIIGDKTGRNTLQRCSHCDVLLKAKDIEYYRGRDTWYNCAKCRKKLFGDK